MNRIIKIFLALLLVFFSSCEENLEELNIDPNTFPTANDAQALSASIGYLGYIVDVDLNFNSILWSQYYTWGIGVSIGNAERFVAEPDDYNGYWQRAYANCLTDLKFVSESDSPAYSGIAKVLEAYIYQGLVDHFGDIPFTEGVSGAIDDGSILQPTYDDSSEIYSGLINKLNDAIADLESAGSDVGEEDFVYDGDLTKWIKFANSLKLRLLMRTSEVSPQSATVINLINSGTFIETIDDMPTIPFSGASGDQNPMYARAEFGVGMFYFASNATLNLLSSLQDPRDEYFYTLATSGSAEGLLRGIDQGTIDDEPFTAPASDYSMASSYSYADTNSVILMSPWEVWFLRAEAAARYGTSDDEVTAFETAIETNFSYISSDIDATTTTEYIDNLAYSTILTLDEKLDAIGIQKWISLNGTQEDEGWIEARRFDRPSSRLFTNGIWQTPPLSVLNDGEFPSAWLYPETERSLNSNAPAQRTLTDNIFWDN